MYKPGATTKTLGLSFSQRKLSGKVFMLYISQGIKDPDFSFPIEELLI